MKILQIVPSISLVYGGPSQMVLGLSAALAQLGQDVTIITTDSNGDTGQAPLEVPLGVPVSQNGYQIYYFPCSPFRRYKFSLDLFTWLANRAKNYDIAHIHALFSPVSSISASIARYHQLPYILRPLGTLDPADLQKKRQLKQIYANFLEKPNLAAAAAVHFTSQQECQTAERFNIKTKDIVIPLGVDFFNPQALPVTGFDLPENKPIILYMSRLDPKKGLDLLLPSLERLLEKGLDFHFVLAGGNPQDRDYENRIKNQIERSILGKNTTITGFVTGEVKNSLLARADLFVLPSYYENFGIAVAEAMAARIPVVISDRVDLHPAVAAAAAGWVTACQLEDLTNTLATAITNPEIRQQRGKNARDLVLNQYSCSAIAEQLLTVYQNLV
ncbi:MAG: glycosyltransferase [Microcystis panniformis Mp_MB_F_20051200_S9]|uniref:Glycosyltransferase n=1 Tax=Microcystis panniformis Mp_MB_F_20051200_S9 TaxID=2486223 RepID=A0A552PSL1_9CHRO|nr:MAG: glycosyltransferase [Microcystis panniformis Mp_MB_F_20080800_S26D]TRV48400.1 MAG: glycosyltransferase [Microcystis panniformis Mp_GB_SS_20050300_S99]TRV53963.1 MAG: glycosyltransferase [Microcystis panniformis Mp_GB_SS_20050300_S99D]TRV54641.1 MAG: glycosyltransferase [Microcystis panniformis Mp_MB_F_20080800_S26]TRV59983.1 MAG: glycosyltransferase [Microcystis panniformis Mp_MB_F_20051200_S9]TRV60159.1 MAG: glycosyltransferase [Microcystis panniformis Mp_MB_F_20051200_S9D]TRV67668.1